MYLSNAEHKTGQENEANQRWVASKRSAHCCGTWSDMEGHAYVFPKLWTESPYNVQGRVSLTAGYVTCPLPFSAYSLETSPCWSEQIPSTSLRYPKTIEGNVRHRRIANQVVPPSRSKCSGAVCGEEEAFKRIPGRFIVFLFVVIEKRYLWVWRQKESIVGVCGDVLAWNCCSLSLRPYVGGAFESYCNAKVRLRR